jgi:hypothetical protein
MTGAGADTWLDANHRFLETHLRRINALLAGDARAAARLEREAAAGAGDFAPALGALAAVFRLTPFERDVLVACAGAELDSAVAAAIAEAQGASGPEAMSFSLALARFPEAHWTALTPEGPLRFWNLVHTEPGAPLTRGPLRIDERILHHMTGVAQFDRRLMAMTTPLGPPGPLPSSQRRSAAVLAAIWSGSPDQGEPPVALLACRDRSAMTDLVATAAAGRGLIGFCLRAADIPSASEPREELQRLWRRECALGPLALLIDCGGEPPSPHLAPFVDVIGGAVAVATDQPPADIGRPCVRLDVGYPSAAEQEDMWRRTLGPAVDLLNGGLDRVLGQFDFSGARIRAVAAALATDNAAPALSDDTLWEACRRQSRPDFGRLARRIKAMATFDDLVLPAPQMATLRQIVAAVRHRRTVLEGWGFAATSARGLGLGALFSGPSGTGKTMAAEALARELSLDLYRVDLSEVASKYIGETEKNLSRVFDAAERGGVVLLFDEADALFGKRTELRDSHDRYANQEVSYLLQRMEDYRGLAILTTNMRDALDAAFMRRIRFMVHFPFPDADTRRRIWTTIFPESTPTEGLEIDRLARLNVSGGHIRNIALAAAFLAADDDKPVRMDHVRRAAESEYAKLDRSLTEAEVGGWPDAPA